MPAADWSTYRVGARLPAVDSLLGADTRNQVARLHTALSSVAYLNDRATTTPRRTPHPDGVFTGRLLLGLLSRGWPTLGSPIVEQALLDAIPPDAPLVCRPAPSNELIGWRLQSAADASPGDWEHVAVNAPSRSSQAVLLISFVILALATAYLALRLTA